MQTFLPYPDFAASARCLDRQRLRQTARRNAADPQRPDQPQLRLAQPPRHSHVDRLHTSPRHLRDRDVPRMAPPWLRRQHRPKIAAFFDTFRHQPTNAPMARPRRLPRLSPLQPSPQRPFTLRPIQLDRTRRPSLPLANPLTGDPNMQVYFNVHGL